MTPGSTVFLGAAAAVGGAINSVAGGGSFISFPALLFSGASPVTANATNTVALWPGSLASAIEYRHELRNSDAPLVALCAASFIGGLAGSILLLCTAEHTFVLLIPWLLAFATLLFTFGQRLAKKLLRDRRAPIGSIVAAQSIVAIYGGYFGGGMGIMMLALLTMCGISDVNRSNAIKNVLATFINGIAVLAFLIAGAIDWGRGGIMIVGGIAGGYAGAAIARRTDPRRVRAAVLGIAWATSTFFFVKTYARWSPW